MWAWYAAVMFLEKEEDVIVDHNIHMWGTHVYRDCNIDWDPLLILQHVLPLYVNPQLAMRLLAVAVDFWSKGSMKVNTLFSSALQNNPKSMKAYGESSHLCSLNVTCVLLRRFHVCLASGCRFSWGYLTNRFEEYWYWHWLLELDVCVYVTKGFFVSMCKVII